MGRIEGEAAQAKGADGARRAKKWLEATTRVNAQWVNPDRSAVPKLQFQWPIGGNNFSYDIGGVLKYDEFDGQTFFAESKAYSNSSDLSSHYREFLAKCYSAYQARAMYCDHFMWISWSPHSASKWSDQTSEESVKKAVVHHRARIFGDLDEESALNLIDLKIVKEVASRLWIIILSEKQEQLVITPKHRGIIEAQEAEKAAS